MENDALADALRRLDTGGTFASAAPVAMERFRNALKAANPQLNEDQMEAYSETFSASIPMLTQVMLTEHLNNISSILSEEELEVMYEFMRHPKIATFLDVLQKNASSTNSIIEKVMREQGVAVHKESFGAAISTL